MSPDEGASWAAASAPTAAEVIARQPALNPGELPIHDLMLHGWIALFGSSMTRCARCRRPSASCRYCWSTLLTVNCLFKEQSALTRDDVGIVAGLGAMVFAVNLVTIKYSREARMYPLMLAAILAQVTMFLRALRAGGLANYAAVAVLTAIAIASNFAAVLIPATEGLWLCINSARAMAPDNAKARRAWVIAIALAAAGIDSGAETFFVVARSLGGTTSADGAKLPLVTSRSRCSTRPPAASHFRSSQRSRFGARSADGTAVRATQSPSRCSGCGRRR